jgi:hypothetical protein
MILIGAEKNNPEDLEVVPLELLDQMEMKSMTS